MGTQAETGRQPFCEGGWEGGGGGGEHGRDFL